jgi:hypothetical protein
LHASRLKRRLARGGWLWLCWMALVIDGALRALLCRVALDEESALS